MTREKDGLTICLPDILGSFQANLERTTISLLLASMDIGMESFQVSVGS